ncbi:hypothetical protein CsSME_00029789 [Camellia sinensis var. sinensis]
MDQLLVTGHAPTQHDQPQFHEACVICASPAHDLSECPSASQFPELVQEHREEGKLPSQTVANPKGQYGAESSGGNGKQHEQVQAVVALRSGRELEPQSVASDVTRVRKGDHGGSPSESKGEGETLKRDELVPSTPYVPKAPFPQCLDTPSPFNKKAASMEAMMERKSRTHVSQKVLLTEQVSSILLNDTPPKLNDPGAPTIACIIGDHFIDRALLDLGASVNLLPYSVYEEFGLGELKPTTVTLQLADRSLKVPRGMIEDVLVKVDRFYFPVDFLALPSILVEDPLEAYLAHFGFENFDIDGSIEEVNVLLNSSSTPDFPPWKARFESLPPLSREPATPSLVTPPTLELKPLPATLKYAFLGPQDTLPVIIASDLTAAQESQLMSVLVAHRSAIGWSVADLKGIDPSMCMHYIHLEEDTKPSREMQRRLNPNMKEVVKKEVLKLLDTGIIYPISDSKWVNPTQVVPKKSGITVVENE